MLALAAYADRLSVRPGETIRFHAANSTGQPVEVSLERVICADPNPAGPGIQVEAVDSQVAVLAAPRDQAVPLGSYGMVDGFGAELPDGSVGVLCKVFPTHRSTNPQVLLSCENGADGFRLTIEADGTLSGVVSGSGSSASARTTGRLELRAWYSVWLSFDADRQTLGVGYRLLGSEVTAPSARSDSGTVGAVARGAPGPGTPLGMAARLATGDGQASAHFTGKLEAPAVVARPLSDADRARYEAGAPLEDVAGAWDFGKEASSSRLVDTGPGRHHGRTVNSPYRGMTGASWSGREMYYGQAPAEYGAIYFHADDLDDCAWPACFEWQVPAGTRSAIYCLQLRAGDEVDNVPFHVVPPRDTRTADIAVLASTFTYTVYGNHARIEWDTDPGYGPAWRAQSAAWSAYPHNPGDHREYGLSTYNNHLDGSGISIASWHRPVLNVRVGYVTYPDESVRASGLRHFPADTHLTAWLEAKGYDYDIITDWELHTEGAEVLEEYRVLLTGSHPEYHTRETLDAIQGFRDAGGRLCYLGGNGFYWKVAINPEKDGVIEIRRGEGGIRAWAAEPGEYYNQFDGEYGGMWRRNGRPPQQLCGVGFTAQGNFSGSYYRRRPEATDSRVAWILEGIEAETFGGHGLSGHGAAGFELDRADKQLGTPRHAVVLASSENHPPEVPWILVPEEMLTHLATWPGEPASELIRADMTFFEGSNGGAVFSTGSITFCGSLVTNAFDNDVSRLLANVVDRFVDPEPFEIPSVE